jgi:hypothetical protein
MLFFQSSSRSRAAEVGGSSTRYERLPVRRLPITFAVAVLPNLSSRARAAPGS